MPDEKTTDADLAAHVDRVCRSLEKVGAVDLLRLADRMRELGAGRARQHVPHGLIAEPDDSGDVTIGDYVQRPTRFTHFVLTPETARAYELQSFFLGVDHQGGNVKPLPLETFSIEYLQNDRLALCQEWKVRPIPPGVWWRLHARLRAGAERVPFRGLLWGAIVD